LSLSSQDKRRLCSSRRPLHWHPLQTISNEEHKYFSTEPFPISVGRLPSAGAFPLIIPSALAARDKQAKRHLPPWSMHLPAPCHCILYCVYYVHQVHSIDYVYSIHLVHFDHSTCPSEHHHHASGGGGFGVRYAPDVWSWSWLYITVEMETEVTLI